MDNNQIEELKRRLEQLAASQQRFQDEVTAIRRKIEHLESVEKPAVTEPPSIASIRAEPVKGHGKQAFTKPASPVTAPSRPASPDKTFLQRLGMKEDGWEKFIGENLISKLGIIITVIGVAIGVRYSIQHDLISPLTRIILGYLAGIILLVTGMRLKKSYENFSAVLVSGGMATMYFITYAAYSRYELMPQWLAFAMMVIFTVFTVYAALRYDQQVIAHFGLVGAYAIPFLLSDGSGRTYILLSFIAIINFGVLVVAFRKQWALLNRSAFFLTWLSFAAAFYSNLSETETLLFGLIFFATFYVTFLAYKLREHMVFTRGDVVMIFLNAFLFFCFGYLEIGYKEAWENYLGLFTIGHALLHFAVALWIRRQPDFDRKIFYAVTGLVLIFLTLAVPVQLDGNWVTLLWAGEAALLFWIGRTKKVSFYEKLSYLAMFLGVVSFIQDWVWIGLSEEVTLVPVINEEFLVHIMFSSAFGFILYLSRKYGASYQGRYFDPVSICNILVPIIFLFSLYLAFYLEIDRFWMTQMHHSWYELADYSMTSFDADFMRFNTLWKYNYTMAFLCGLIFVAIRTKSTEFAAVMYVLTGLTLFTFFIIAYPEINRLGENYFDPPYEEVYIYTWINVAIRYVSVAFVAFTLYAAFRLLRSGILTISRPAFDIPFHVTILALLSGELLFWSGQFLGESGDKLVLSILWGAYALFMIVLGIVNRRKHLRISAIVLFGVTLLKLFFYDLIHLSTVYKTIVFVALGILLLVISYLYNRYKTLITDE